MADYNLNIDQLAYVIKGFVNHWRDDESKLKSPRGRLSTWVRNSLQYDEKALQSLNTQGFQGDYI